MNTAGVSLEMTVLATKGKKQQEDLEASEQCIQFLNLRNHLSIIILPNSCYRSITLQLRTTQRSRQLQTNQLLVKHLLIAKCSKVFFSRINSMESKTGTVFFSDKIDDKKFTIKHKLMIQFYEVDLQFSRTSCKGQHYIDKLVKAHIDISCIRPCLCQFGEPADGQSLTSQATGSTILKIKDCSLIANQNFQRLISKVK